MLHLNILSVCASIEPLDLSTSCFKGAGCNAAEFEALVPASVTTLSGSCVTVPCSFTVRDGFEDKLHPGCILIWKKNDKITISTTFKGNLTAYNCTTTLNNVLEDNFQYYFRIDCGNPLRYDFSEYPVTIQIKGKCNVCPPETNMYHKSYWSHCGSDYAWVSIVTALNWFGTQGSLMHLV